MSPPSGGVSAKWEERNSSQGFSSNSGRYFGRGDTQAAEALETQLQANQRSRHTVKSYLRDVSMLHRWLEREGHPLDVERITPTTLLQFAASTACTHQEDGRPRKPSSIDKIKMSIRAFFGFLFEAAIIWTNPALVLKYRRGREGVRETLMADECRLLVDAATGANGVRDAMILALMLETGIRLESLVALDVGDVRLDEAKLVLRSMKGGNEAVKAIAPSLRKRLDRYLRRRLEEVSPCPALFLSNRGLRLCARQIQQMLERRGRKAGVAKRVTPHGLRRTYATRLYVETKDLLLVQRALDHRFVGTTMRYALPVQM